MKSPFFYKAYGLLIFLAVEGFFLFIYSALEFAERSTLANVTYIAVYQGIVFITVHNYYKLYKAYKSFLDMKRKQKEEAETIE